MPRGELSFFTYLGLKAFLFPLRFILALIRSFPTALGGMPYVKPSREYRIPSTKDPRRQIRIRVYNPPESLDGDVGPLPVHINLSPSGFMISGYGIYSAFCAYLASELHCVVLDADYALGPEYQFPGAYDDVVDVVSHVLSSMRTFDTDRITMGGVSSGGSLAICVTATAPVANNRIKGIVATCVPIDFNRSGESLHSTAPPRPSSKFPGITLAAGLWDLTRKVYVPPSHSSDDPRISPIAVDTSLLPPTMIICGEYDVLRPDGEAFGEKIIMAGGVAEVEVIEGVGHGWDTAYYKPGTLGAKKVQEGWEITRKSLAGCQKRVFE